MKNPVNIEIRKGDLLSADVDVIVNAWNRNIIPWWLLIPRGVSGAIKRKAGWGPFWQLPWAPIPLGQAVLTGAGKLPHKAIIHVAGINLFWKSTEDSIRASVIHAVKLAEGNGFQSIAFPIIGSGSGGMSKEKALTIMQATLETTATQLQVQIVDYENGDDSIES